MPDPAALARLSYSLIGLYPTADDARALAERAGLNPANIAIVGAPRVFWWNVVREAEKTRGLEGLIQAALQDYPGHEDLVAAEQEKWDSIIEPVAAPDLPADRWRPKIGAMRAEKIMGAQATFLPVSFLQVGVERARSVARVVLPDRTAGTGFLIPDNLLITNHHVISSPETAAQARIQFNFQESAERRPEEVSEWQLDPAGGFNTSPMEEGHDWTVVRLAGDANAEWGALTMHGGEVQVEDRVTIVQHPEGGFKKVALHHNLVVYVDDDVLQYYTDTLPGSSGSPVFDHSWRVVALHHAGGDLVEPGSGKPVFRNEGINIARVIDGVDGL